MLNEDYKEMLQILLDNKVKFLIVGAYAMGMHGYPRATGDLDIWVQPSTPNSINIYNSLAKFGATLDQINAETFIEKKIVFQVGIVPRRIDILTFIDGVEFDAAFKNRDNIEIEGITIPFLSKKDLIKNKEASGRGKDKLDANYLKKNLNG
jgi:hypothetical protein